MHDLEIIVALFRNHGCNNPLCDVCGVIEDVTHYFFHSIKYIDERQVFNDTVNVCQPLTINLIFLEAKTGILKQIWSCSGLSTDKVMPQKRLVSWVLGQVWSLIVSIPDICRFFFL